MFTYSSDRARYYESSSILPSFDLRLPLRASRRVELARLRDHEIGLPALISRSSRFELFQRTVNRCVPRFPRTTEVSRRYREESSYVLRCIARTFLDQNDRCKGRREKDSSSTEARRVARCAVSPRETYPRFDDPVTRSNSATPRNVVAATQIHA